MTEGNAVQGGGGHAVGSNASSFMSVSDGDGNQKLIRQQREPQVLQLQGVTNEVNSTCSVQISRFKTL